MTPREIFGLVLLAIAFTLAPFGYWLSFKWALAALLFGIPGSVLYFTARTTRKLSQQDPDANHIYASKEMKGNFFISHPRQSTC